MKKKTDLCCCLYTLHVLHCRSFIIGAKLISHYFRHPLPIDWCLTISHSTPWRIPGSEDDNNRINGCFEFHSLDKDGLEVFSASPNFNRLRRLLWASLFGCIIRSCQVLLSIARPTLQFQTWPLFFHRMTRRKGNVNDVPLTYDWRLPINYTLKLPIRRHICLYRMSPAVTRSTRGAEDK